MFLLTIFPKTHSLETATVRLVYKLPALLLLCVYILENTHTYTHMSSKCWDFIFQTWNHSLCIILQPAFKTTCYWHFLYQCMGIPHVLVMALYDLKVWTNQNIFKHSPSSGHFRLFPVKNINYKWCHNGNPHVCACAMCACTK